MKNRDSLEFYYGDILVARACSSMVPVVGTKISIKKKPWLIEAVNFSVDYSDEDRCSMRCNVELDEI